jgi:hypothetical protein
VRRTKSLSVLSIVVIWGCQNAGPEEEDADPDEVEDTVIALRSGDVDTRAPGAIPDELRDDATDRVLVQFPGPPTAEQIAALGQLGTIYAYLPTNAYLVRLGAEQRRTTNVLAGIGASWSGPYHPAYKIAPSVGTAIASASAQPRVMMVQVFPDADLAKVRADIAALGYRIVGEGMGQRFGRIRVIASPAELARGRDELARNRDVFWIDVERRIQLLNDTTIFVGQSGVNGTTTPIFDHGIHGEGQIVGVLDTGIDPDMCYFRDPARGLPAQNPCNGGTSIDAAQRKILAVDFLFQNDCDGGVANDEWDDHSHGTHVAGTIAGDNFANVIGHDAGDGMAPAAKLVVQDGGFGTDDCADLPGIGCPVVDLNPLFEQAFKQGARIHSNSWGDNENAEVQNNYSAGSQDVDEFMFAHKDFQIFFAAGNSGPGAGSVGSPATAKSVLSIGATRRGVNANEMAFFSSCGPTDDNRIKPDITIPGAGIISASSDFNVTTNNCGTFSSSGTSMATPAAAGFGALVRQYYVDGFFPTGTKVPANGFTPSSALIRATMISSAREMTINAGNIPNNCQGWGRILLDDALAFSGETRKLVAVDEANGFPSGGAGMIYKYELQVSSSAEPLKVTLAWTDFPSTPAAAIHLVNDLDVTVTGPGGTFLGNVFSGGASTTGGSADRRNTIEQVLLRNPPTGTYTVTVRAQNVPSGPQPFALVATGAVTAGAQTTTVFADNFESFRGWKMNPDGTDTATDGQWVRGNPTSTSSNGPKQLGTTNSGLNDLVTGRTKGESAGSNDLDGGTSTVQSPTIALPATGNLQLTFAWYFAHSDNSSSSDFFRIEVLGSPNATVVEEIGSASDDDAAWELETFDLSPWKGQTIRLRITARDGGSNSLVEAAVDDVMVLRQP